MRTVEKFILIIGDVDVEMLLPVGAEVLRFDYDGVNWCLWAIVDTTVEERQLRLYHVVGTGHPITFENTDGYVGSASNASRSLTFHLFEDESTAPWLQPDDEDEQEP